MHLESREDEQRRRTRVIVWSDSTSTDLAALVFASVSTAALVAGIVFAAELDGIPHVVALIVAVLSGVLVTFWLVPVLVIVGGIFIVKGLAAKTPTTAQRASWVVAAAALGALLGTDTYMIGLPGLFTGPLVLTAVVALLRAGPGLSARARHRLLALSSIVAAAAVVVSLTIFL